MYVGFLQSLQFPSVFLEWVPDPPKGLLRSSPGNLSVVGFYLESSRVPNRVTTTLYYFSFFFRNVEINTSI